MKQKNWIILSLLLIIVGAILLVANNVIYLPRFTALGEATKAWAESHTGDLPPNPASYGIDNTAFIISFVLGFAGGILIFIGAAYFVIYFIAKIVKKLGYTKNQTNEESPRPQTSIFIPSCFCPNSTHRARKTRTLTLWEIDLSYALS